MILGFSFRKLALIILFAGGVNTACGQLLWSDEFDTGISLDPNTWSYDLGDSGWGNQELQNYTNDPGNVRLEDGNLVITVRSTGEGENRQFTSARVRTQDKLTFKYGRIEARIKVPDLADGLWPAFWTLGNNFSQVGWPYCGELDIMEMGSAAAITADVINRRVGSTAHWDSDGTWASYTRSYDTASNLDDGFHIFSMNWTPERVTTYIDGQQIWTFYIKSDTCASCSEFHQPHFVILNMAVGGNYTGLLNANQITATMPAEMLIDYVRIYDNGFTEMGGSSMPEPTVPGLEYSGSWFNQDQSGHGFSMAFSTEPDGTPLAVAYWYTYDASGNPMFLLGTGSLDGETLEIEFESPYGMVYGDFDPNTVNREQGGVARFEFLDKDNATFSYEPSDFTASAWGHSAIESLPLTKLFSVSVSDSTGSAE